MNFEESLIWNASPTLASIKVANLYNFRFGSMRECLDTIDVFNDLMNPKGIYIELLKNDGNFYLIYVYRKSHLHTELTDMQVRLFLDKFGYSSAENVQGYIEVLKNRLQGSSDFPHEVGVFLGYPLEDVKAFIETSGKNCVFCGEWKAYHDKQRAACMFCKYNHCREVYVRVYNAGRKLSDMLVSA